MYKLDAFLILNQQYQSSAGTPSTNSNEGKSPTCLNPSRSTNRIPKDETLKSQNKDTCLLSGKEAVTSNLFPCCREKCGM